MEMTDDNDYGATIPFDIDFDMNNASISGCGSSSSSSGIGIGNATFSGGGGNINNMNGIEYSNSNDSGNSIGNNNINSNSSNTQRFIACCKVCGTTTGLRRCSRCKSVYYCSQVHQRSDWPVHKIGECFPNEISASKCELIF